MTTEIERELKSGRKVVFREATGLDDIACSQITGEGVTQETLEKNIFGHMTLTQAALMVLTLVSYDGGEVAPPQSMKDILEFAKSVPLRDWNQMFKFYKEINEFDEEKQPSSLIIQISETTFGW